MAHLTSVYLQIPGNDVMAFAVSTADKGLTTYRVPAEGELEQLGRWGGVDHVLVGDFANLCRDQLLVAFNESENKNVSEKKALG